MGRRPGSHTAGPDRQCPRTNRHLARPFDHRPRPLLHRPRPEDQRLRLPEPRPRSHPHRSRPQKQWSHPFELRPHPSGYRPRPQEHRPRPLQQRLHPQALCPRSLVLVAPAQAIRTPTKPARARPDRLPCAAREAAVACPSVSASPWPKLRLGGHFASTRGAAVDGRAGTPYAPRTASPPAPKESPAHAQRRPAAPRSDRASTDDGRGHVRHR